MRAAAVLRVSFLLFVLFVPAWALAQTTPAPPPPAEPALHVVGTYPLPGQGLADHIIVYFDEALDWKSGEPPFSLTSFYMDAGGRIDLPNPRVNRWGITKNYLSILLECKDSAIYRLGLNPALASASGKKLAPDSLLLHFAKFQFPKLSVRYVEQKNDAHVFALDFSTAMDPAIVTKHLHLQDKGQKPVPFEIASGSNSSSIHLKFSASASLPALLTADAGLPDASNSLRSAQAVSIGLLLPEALTVKSATWRTDFGTAAIDLQFSGAVASTDLKELLSINDATTGAPIPFKLAETNAARLTPSLEIGVDKAASIKLEIRAGLSGAEHLPLAQAYTTTLNFDPASLRPAPQQPKQEFRIESVRWNQWETQGEITAEIQFSLPVLLEDLQAHLQIEPDPGKLNLKRSYGNTYLVGAEWESNRDYKVRFTKGLKFNGTQETNADIERQLPTSRVPASLQFGTAETFYFPKRHGTNIPLNSRNCPSAEIVAYRIFPNNLTHNLRGEWGGATENLAHQGSGLGEEVGRTTVQLPKVADKQQTTMVDVAPLLGNDLRGVFCLRAFVTVREPNEDEYESDGGDAQGGERPRFTEKLVETNQLLIHTDIGVLAHWVDRELELFTHHLTTLAPLEGASVTVYSNKNQVLAQANTGADGFLHLSAFDARLGVPSMIVVDTGKDSTFLDLETRDEGVKALNGVETPFDETGYDAFLYADRDLYRPGEAVHLRWLVRQHYGAAAPAMPLLLSIKKPNGKELLSQPVDVSALGSGTFDLATQKAYPTGKYTAEIHVPGSQRVIGSYPLSLEEFVPNRMEAKTAVGQERVTPGQVCPVTVTANHLTGPPAAQRRCQTEVVLRDTPVELPKWPGYLFGNDTPKKKRAIALGEQRTDDKGQARFDFTYAPEPEDTAPRKAVAVGHVFELGGRAVHGGAECTLFPSETCLGLNSAYDKGTRELTVRIAAVKPDESPAALATAKLTLERRQWNYHVRRYGGYDEPRWAESFVEVSTTDLPLTEGRGETRIPMPDYGYYRVRVHSPETPQYSTTTFFAYGYGCDAVSGEQASLLKITPLKPRYAAGEMAELRIESPFDGKAVVVLQGGRFHHTGTTEVRGGAGTFAFRVLDDMFPCLWAEVTIIHAVPEGGAPLYPYSSFGMAAVPIDRPDRRLNVAFDNLPALVRPETPMPLTLTVTDANGKPAAGEITVAAVDDGIHGITNYQNPDPYAWLIRPRKPDFRRAHYYDRVAYEMDKPAPGGSDPLAGLRLGRPDNTWIKTVALWSGVAALDESGKAQVTLPVPAFSGRLRLVAVANTANAMGVAAGTSIVKRDVELSTSMPRFLLPGDTAQCRAAVMNYTDKPCTAKVSWRAEGGLGEKTDSASLTVPANGEAACTAPITAGNAVGQGTLLWTAEIFAQDNTALDRIEERDDLPVRAPSGVQTHRASAMLKPGESRRFENSEYVDDAMVRAELSVSAVPNLRMAHAFRYLAGYPYGCVEQTTSKLWPMFLMQQNAAFSTCAQNAPKDLPQYIQAGIDRLFSMQTADGGLGFWPGDDRSYPYGAIYALHFLTAAKQAKAFNIPAGSFAQLQDYARGIVNETGKRAPETGYYYPEAESSRLYQRAYALFVLALDGDLSAIQQIPRFDSMDLPRPARYLLAAALAMNTQDSDRVAKYLATARTTPYDVYESYGTLTTAVRNQAVELLALEYMNGDAQKRLDLAQALLKWLDDGARGTTQENAFVITALGRFFASHTGDVSKAAASVAPPSAVAATIAGKDTYRGVHDGPGGVFTVTNTGQTDIFANWFTAGLPKTPPTEAVQKGIEIARTLRHEDGTEAKGAIFDQGAAYIVDLRFRCPETTRNLIVSDLLPPGFEVENPRLNAEALPSPDLSKPEQPAFLEIRDDRVITAYNQLEQGEHHFYYIVRAITPGSYAQPGLLAEGMYDPNVHAETLPQRIEVKSMP